MKQIRSVTLNIDEKVKALKSPDTYPFFVSEVESKETHMSWVFLTDDFAFKIKKPFRNSFQDLTTIDLRYKHLLLEFELNQPLANKIYLGLVPLLLDSEGHLKLGEENMEGGYQSSTGEKWETVDWVIKMKRIPEGQMLDFAIRQKKVEEGQIRDAARFLVNFYIKTPPEILNPSLFWKKLKGEIDKSYTDLLNPEFNLNEERITNVKKHLVQFLHDNVGLFEKRVSEGRIIEAHGDLKPEHIKIVPSPAVIDRLEFNREFRILDIAEELSYLTMECEFLGSKEAGKLFLDVYAEKSGDRIPHKLMLFYMAKRAFLRTFLVVRHILEPKYKKDPKWMKKSIKYLELAEKYSGFDQSTF